MTTCRLGRRRVSVATHITLQRWHQYFTSITMHTAFYPPPGVHLTLLQTGCLGEQWCKRQHRNHIRVQVHMTCVRFLLPHPLISCQSLLFDLKRHKAPNTKKTKTKKNRIFANPSQMMRNSERDLSQIWRYDAPMEYTTEEAFFRGHSLLSSLIAMAYQDTWLPWTTCNHTHTHTHTHSYPYTQKHTHCRSEQKHS